MNRWKLLHKFSMSAGVIAASLLVGFPAVVRGGPAGDSIEFNRDIRPLLSDRCFHCHGPDAGQRQAELRLDTQEGSRHDLGGHAAVVPGKPEESELYRRLVSADEDERMPPVETGKGLSPEEIELMRRWIAAGAAYQSHWSYTAPERPPLPEQETSPLDDGAIDRFVGVRLQEEGLAAAAAADRQTLARRLHLDLLGLAPSPAIVRSFLSDERPDAYERLVDRLLASPRYGERMAMYWLDLVRYADSVGYHGDQEHNITPYRDYVIHAFNENLPFDQFTIEQLAGDLLPGATVEQKIASGYNRLLQTTHEGGAQDREYLAKYAADRVRNVSGVWMGATMGCAECHDHKYDPYTQKDFYSLVAFFADIDERGAYGSSNDSPTQRPPEIDVLSWLDREELAAVESRLKDLEVRLAQVSAADGATASGGVDDLDAAIEAAKQERERLEARRRRTMVTVAVEPRTIRVLGRGDWMDESGEVVQPAVPHFLEPLQVSDRATRLDLARWLTNPRQPQTARVFMNRIWYIFFGGGLSKVLDDTGSQGERPTHPELLDHLAVEFIESGWDVKSMVRRIVTSSTYRQTSLVTPELAERDPDNRLFARQARFRLPAESIRDNALAVSGLLVETIGGASAHPYQPAGYYAHLNFPKRSYQPDDGPGQYRRGVYTHWQRQFLHPTLKAFDAPQREECTAQRSISNTPLAALTLLNDPSFVEAAKVFAARIVEQGGEKTEARIRWAWWEALSRAPSPPEVAALVKLYKEERQQYTNDPEAAKALLSVGLTAPACSESEAPELAAWTTIARTIFNLNEAITRN